MKKLEDLFKADFETLKNEVIELAKEVHGLFRVKKRTGMTLAEATELHEKNNVALMAVSNTLADLKNKEREVSLLIESKSGEFKEVIFKYQAKNYAIKELENYQNKLLYLYHHLFF